MLTEAVRRRPYQVVLLDEFEKAHREVSNLLLQVFDEGHLTDSHGRKVDFRNTIIIMTSCELPLPPAWLPCARRHQPQSRSNLGSDVLSSMPDTVPPGDPGVREQIMEHVRAHFSPEFINRIDEAVVFDRLRREHMGSIADIQVRGRSQRRGLSVSARCAHGRPFPLPSSLPWAAQGGAAPARRPQGAAQCARRHQAVACRVRGLCPPPGARLWAMGALTADTHARSVGYDPRYGARPLKRAIQTHLLNPLARALLSGKIKEEEEVDVLLPAEGEGPGLVFHAHPRTAAKGGEEEE